jgi:hypothetical protein
MPNPIKYTTGSETLALKKGNFYIGTGDVGKGPTSSTGYYNGISPPSGGYTIYLNKESGGPSIYIASNDAQLISLTNSIAGQSYTSATQCLVYYASQTDKVCLNRDYEGIVTDGLVLNFDAGFTPSYPTSGTSWYDLGPSGNTTTLFNNPTFSSDGGGSLSLDGTDDYGVLANNPGAWGNNSLTLTVIVYPEYDVEQYGRPIFTKNQGCSAGEFAIDYGRSTGGGGNGPNTFLFFSSNVFAFGSSAYTKNNWYIVTAVYNSSNGYYAMYVNNVLQTSGTKLNMINNNNGTFGIGRFNGCYPTVPPFKGKIANIMLYNRALTASEILQNYNAQKGRFGL